MDALWKSAAFESDSVDSIDGNSYSSDSIDGNEMEHCTDEHGATLLVSLGDGRMDASVQPTFLSVCPVPGDSQLFYIRLQTSHYSFSIKKSCVARSGSSFYQLRSILKSHHPYLTMPSLPMLPSLWICSYHTISLQLVTFLSTVVAERELLSNKALHLFLQTELSMEKIKDNLEGKRDDEVLVPKSKIVKDERNNTKEGFGALFGNVNNNN
eukprot:GFUD01044744.1.p1 GENE.GFUD01044744.1~~GFUD01044744.1.p1  ORF type:complete len:211 (-),score=73.49 GFUD01044744.1:94-726(-)